MLTRTISGIVFILIVIGALILGYSASTVLFSIIGTIGVLEYYRLGTHNSQPIKWLGMGLTASIILFGGYLMVNKHAVWIIAILIFWIIPIIFAALNSESKTVITDLSITLAGSLYIAIPFLSLLGIGIYPSFEESGFNWQLPLSIFMLTWANDTGAYLIGRSFGKHKLFERISPKKTWEGSSGGLVFSILLGLILSLYWGLFTNYEWIIISILVSIFSNVGDLMESAFKRNAGVKDSGKIMPGHGGVLDRFDAILLTAPIIFGFLILMSII